MNNEKKPSKLKLSIKSLDIIPEADQNNIKGGAITSYKLCLQSEEPDCWLTTETKTESSGCLTCVDP